MELFIYDLPPGVYLTLRISCILAECLLAMQWGWLDWRGPGKGVENCDTGLAPHQLEPQWLSVATMNVSPKAKDPSA